MPSTVTVPVQFTVDVHEIPGGGFYGEVRQLPGCLAQADIARSRMTGRMA